MKIILLFLSVVLVCLNGLAKGKKVTPPQSSKRKVSQVESSSVQNVQACLQGLKLSSENNDNIILKADLEGVIYLPNIESCLVILGNFIATRSLPNTDGSGVLLGQVLEKKLSVNALTPTQILGIIHSAIRAEKFSSGIFGKLISVGFFKNLTADQIESITHL